MFLALFCILKAWVFSALSAPRTRVFPALLRISKARAFSILSAPRTRVFPALLRTTEAWALPAFSESTGVSGSLTYRHRKCTHLQHWDSKAAHLDVCLNHRTDQSPRAVKPAARTLAVATRDINARRTRRVPTLPTNHAEISRPATK